MPKDEKVSQEQLDLMRHTVGLDWQAIPYRNYFFSGEECDGYSDLVDLVNMGFMTSRESTGTPNTMFHLTDKGCRIINLTGLDAIS